MTASALAIVKPTRSRRQHDAIERVDGRELIDVAGLVSTPWRVLSLLDAMERRGAITADMREAGEDFYHNFRVAQLDGLRAASLERAGGGWSGGLLNGNERARKAVMASVAALGGGRAPAASCSWHVLGLEWSLRRWSGEYRHGSVNEASGILIAALGVLAKG